MPKRKTQRRPRAKKLPEVIAPLPTLEPEVSTFTFDPIKIDAPLPSIMTAKDVPMKRVSKTVKWPATWWDHFKQDVFPISWQLRWPSSYAEVTYWTEVVDRERCPTNPFAVTLMEPNPDKIVSDSAYYQRCDKPPSDSKA